MSFQTGGTPRMMNITWASLAALAFCLTARAELSWPATELKLVAQPKQPSVSGEYHFTNKSADAVRILSAKPSCTCLKLEFPRETIPPGSGGAIVVEYEVGGRTGQQEAKITVISSDAPDRPTVLTLSVNIPEEVSLQPRFVFWQRGEPGEKKFLEIVVADPKKYSVESASCADPAFAVTMEPAVTPGHYRLAIKPKDATRPAQAVVRIELRTEGRLEIRTAYVAVK
jgi:hypothetical protein